MILEVPVVGSAWEPHFFASADAIELLQPSIVPGHEWGAMSRVLT